MTPEQMRVAIAEDQGIDCTWVKIALEQFKDRDGYPEPIFTLGRIPNYPEDLNAMHAVETGMMNHDWWMFVEELTKTCGAGVALCISATAPQRAEAYLRTKGLWKE